MSHSDASMMRGIFFPLPLASFSGGLLQATFGRLIGTAGQLSSVGLTGCFSS